jgi:hypothetical protein
MMPTIEELRDRHNRPTMTIESYIMNLSTRALVDAVAEQITFMEERGWTSTGYLWHYRDAARTSDEIVAIRQADRDHLDKLLLSLTVRTRRMTKEHA